MSEIYFVRHAQASFGKEDYDHLSDLGQEQANKVGEHFTRLGMAFHGVYSGSLQRQRRTALIALSRMPKVLEDHELHIAPEFNEYASSGVMTSQMPYLSQEEPGLLDDFERIYTDRKVFQRVFEGAMIRWVSGQGNSPGVETWEEFKGRVRLGIQRVMEETGRKRRALVFASGGTISAAVQMALRIPDLDTLRLSWQIRNASITVFMYNGKEFSLSSFNSTAALELSQDVRLITYR